MTDTTAKIRAKGLDGTGVTEEIASTLYANKGKHVMAIVELHAVERHEKADGTRRVDLTVEMVEPAEGDLADHLRNLASVAYQNRAVTDTQQALDDSLTPDLKDAVAAGAAHAPHPFLPTDAADDLASCEVCGLGETAAPHRAYAKDQLADPFEPDAATGTEDDQEPMVLT